MYALIGREMTIGKLVLMFGGDTRYNPFATGSPDDDYTRNAYLIGFYLYEGDSLADLMRQGGRLTQRPGGWERKEWPSWETSDASLVRAQRIKLQQMIE